MTTANEFQQMLPMNFTGPMINEPGNRRVNDDRP